MDPFNVVANTVRVQLVGLADWLYGCSHRRTTFPITLRANVSVDGQQSTQAETYVVLRVRTPVCIRLDQDAHHEAAWWVGPEVSRVQAECFQQHGAA
jgi:hypothetical protein